MEHWDLLPGVDPKIICTIIVVCSLVGTFVMFYEEETSPARLRKTTRPTSCKESFVCNCWFVAMMTNRARHQHGTPFGADALFGEDIHPFFRTVQADQGHACPTLLVLCCFHKAGDWCFSPTGKRGTKKRKQEKRKEKHFVQSGL